MELQFDFDSLEIIEVPVKYQGKSYVLREGSEDSVAKFKNKVLKFSQQQQKEGIISEGLNDLAAFLVSLCLWEKVEQRDGTIKEARVPESVIRQWPHPIVDQLFETAHEISKINGQDTVEILEEKVKLLQQKIEALKQQGGDQAKN